jgi:hypothetical protein
MGFRLFGAIAQLGEHLNRTQGVGGSSPPSSTAMSRFTSDDPERSANIAFAVIVVGIIAVGALTIWFFYGAR